MPQELISKDYADLLLEVRVHIAEALMERKTAAGEREHLYEITDEIREVQRHQEQRIIALEKAGPIATTDWVGSLKALMPQLLLLAFLVSGNLRILEAVKIAFSK